jgi:TIR domain-containing protein
VRVFISYASEDRSIAEQVHYALVAAGHDTFFDRSDIDGGAGYHQVILDRIQGSDAMVFLVTSHSVAPGKYTLTELRHAEERWRHPQGRVLGVRADEVPVDRIPAFLRAGSVLEPRGNVAAEVAAAVARLPGLQTSSTAIRLRDVLTRPLIECPQFLRAPGQYVLTRTQREAPLGHALASSTVLFLLGLVAAIAIGAAQRAEPASAIFLALGTVTLWLGYAAFLHVFSWFLGARRGLPFTVTAYLYVMGFLQPVFAGMLFLVTVFVPGAVKYQAVTLGFGGSGAAVVVGQGRLFAHDASLLFRTASGMLILGYFAVAVAAAHRIKLWRGLTASALSFVFFLAGFGVLLLLDQLLAIGIITRLAAG